MVKKYLGIIMDEHLLFKTHIELMKQEITGATGLLAKYRHCVPLRLLKSVCVPLINSHMRHGRYGWYIWGQNYNSHIRDIEEIQNKDVIDNRCSYIIIPRQFLTTYLGIYFFSYYCSLLLLLLLLLLLTFFTIIIVVIINFLFVGVEIVTTQKKLIKVNFKI